MVKVAAVAIIAAVCAVVVKKNVQDLGMVLAIGAGVIILLFVLGAVEQIRSFMDELTEMAGLAPEVITPVIKTVGIAIITRVTAEICRDAREGGIATATETAGAILALLVALPLLRAVIKTISGLL